MIRRHLNIVKNGRPPLLRRPLSQLPPTIKQILHSPPSADSEVIAHGHIKAIRSFRNVGFLDISDGSIHLTLNVVFNDPDKVLVPNKYKVGQSVAVKGKWIESQGKQTFELRYDAEDPNHSISVLGNVPEDYPIQKKSQTLQFLRTLPTLRHRTSTLSSILRFRSHVETILLTFFRNNDVIKVAPPLITSSDCEGAGEQFAVQPTIKNEDKEGGFFGKEVFLTVSTQLHLEVLALSLNRVWTLTPCFRAEESNTNRHLSEFWMLEAELCYVEDVSQLTQFVESMIRHVARTLKEESGLYEPGSLNDLVSSRYEKGTKETLYLRWDAILSENPWPSITYTEAIDILNAVKNRGRLKGRLQWGDSILTEHEKWLAGTHFNSPVFVTDYPREQKPFYMPMSKSYDPERPTVACFDLIVPEIGELIGGSLREHDLAKLTSEIDRRGMRSESIQWYLSTRENGGVPHGGFGMGFERFIAYLGAVDSIRDISAFPRAPQTCAC